MKPRRIRILTALLFSVLLGLPLGASAVPITGAIGFGGAFVPTGGTDLSDATGINFLTAFVLDGEGDYAGIPVFTGASFTDFDFSPLLDPDPVSPLWQVIDAGITYSFDLSDVAVDFQTATDLNLSGTGTLMATGFDDTAGEWVFSGQCANDECEIVWTFSSITAAVPEPGMLTLLALGLVGIGAAARRRRRAGI